MIVFCLMDSYAVASNETVTHNTISVCNDCFYAIHGDGILYRYKYKQPYYFDRIMITDNVIEIDKNYFIKEDGSLYICNNETCELSMIDSDVEHVSAGENFVLILKKNGDLYGIGSNACGELGQGLIETMPISHEGETYDIPHCIPASCDTPVKIMEDVKDAKAGYAHSVILKNNGSVWTLGENFYGQIGDGFSSELRNQPYNVINNIEHIFAGGAASFARSNENGYVYRWGTNYIHYMGQLDKFKYGAPIIYEKDIKNIINVPGYNYVIKNDDSLWIYGESADAEMFKVGNTLNYAEIPIKILDNVDNIAGIDNGYDKELNVVLNKNGCLSVLELSDYDKVNNKILCKLRKVSCNIRLTSNTYVCDEFEDLNNQSKQVENAINNLHKGEIIKGVTQTEFMPNKEITRAEISVLLLRMTGKENEKEKSVFGDVTPDKWYYNIAGISQKYGIIEGYDDNTFHGEEAVSDVQLAVLAAMTLRNEGTAIEPEKKKEVNLNNIPEWARTDVEYAYNYNLVTEDEIKSFSNKPMTRGEAAVILYRLYNEI